MPARGIGRPTFEEAVSRWFPLADKPRTWPIERWSEWQPDPNLLTGQERRYSEGTRLVVRRREDAAGVARALTALALGVSEGAAGGSEVCAGR